MYRYFSYLGTENVALRRTITTRAEEAEDSWAALPDGTLLIYMNGGSHICSGPYSVGSRVLKVPLKGTVSTYDISRFCFSGVVRALPDGGALVVATSSQWASSVSQPLLRISPTGAMRLLPTPLPSHTTMGEYAGNTAYTDARGNITLVRTLKHDQDDYDTFVQVLVLDSNGTQKASYATPHNNADRRRDTVTSAEVATAPGAIYFQSNGGEYPSYSMLQQIQAPEVGLDYPRSAIIGGPTGSSTVDYVALGDSFSSGEGVEPFDVESDVTCHRSTLAYARLLDQQASLPVSLRRFVACSGATTANITTSGQYGEARQIDAIKATDGIVSLTIGGNDVKFADFVRACLTPFSSGGTGCDKNTAIYKDVVKRISTLSPALAKAYRAIRTKIGAQTRVLVVGYPFIVRYSQWLTRCVLTLDSKEMMAAEEMTTALNTAIATTVASLNDKRFQYIDASSSSSPFYGHDMCSSSPHFNNVVVLPYYKYMYSAHPNQPGQQDYATLLTPYMRPLPLTVASPTSSPVRAVTRHRVRPRR